MPAVTTYAISDARAIDRIRSDDLKNKSFCFLLLHCVYAIKRNIILILFKIYLNIHTNNKIIIIIIKYNLYNFNYLVWKILNYLYQKFKKEYCSIVEKTLI